MIWILVFMDSRSKQVYFISMYIRYVLDIHTCFKVARQTYFDYPIHVLEKSSLTKIQVLFLIKFARLKNELNMLIHVLKLLSLV